MTGWKWLAAGLGVAALAAGCGALTSPESKTTATTTATATETATATATATQTVTAQPSPPPGPTQSGVSRPPEVQAGVVPNVVGLNHQLAQDTLQAAGFYNLREEDATGQGRLLINDRNWVVVSQDPSGGTRTAPDTVITLHSKKIGE
jgi:hypothetical protein